MEKTSRSELYTTDDGTRIEINCYRVKNSKACIIIWPGTGLDVKFYNAPVKYFNEKGYSVLFYNPRSHGKSEGQITRENIINDITSYLKNNSMLKEPLIVIGHSAGCDTMLNLSNKSLNILKYFMISPILNTRYSMQYQYRENPFNEIVPLIALRSENEQEVLDSLSNESWLDSKYWENYGLKEKLDSASSSPLIGQFLEEFFVNNYNYSPMLKKLGKQVVILLPKNDTWFPVDLTKFFADENNIEYKIVEEANDHFFGNAWDSVWTIIGNELN